MLEDELIAGLKIKSRVAFDFLIQQHSLKVINTCYKLNSKKSTVTSGKMILKRN